MIKLINTAVILTVLIILIRSYRKTAKAREKAQLTFTELTSRICDLLENCKRQNLKFRNYMGDDGNCFVLCSGYKDNVQVIMTGKEYMKIRLNSEKDCIIKINKTGKNRFDRIVCMITSEDLEEPFELVLCSHKHGEKSFIGKSVLTNAENFRKDFLEK